MTPLKIAALAAIPLLAAGVIVAPAQAAESSGRVITLIGSNATLGINDNGIPGPTPGDVRTLSLSLTNTKGQPAGRAEVVQTLTYHSANVGTAIKVVVLSLPRGTISAIGKTEFTDFTDPQGRPNDRTESIAIVGGTGA